MSHPLRISRSLTVIALFIMLSTCGVALAHGEMGAHVDEFQSHLEDYEHDINDLLDRVDSIVADYSPDNDVAGRTDALVEQWEQVGFHAALETHAIALYPPIWVALGGFKQAVSENAAAAQVRQWQQRIDAALWQGMGALKLAATQSGKMGHDGDHDTPTQAKEDDRPAITIIKDNLDQVASIYRSGNADGARKLVHATYMQRFEGIEGDLIEQDSDLVTGLEEDFNATLPLLIENGASPNEVRAQIDAMNAKLDRARHLLEQADQNQSAVF